MINLYQTRVASQSLKWNVLKNVRRETNQIFSFLSLSVNCSGTRAGNLTEKKRKIMLKGEGSK
jgi:hypothetical protein